MTTITDQEGSPIVATVVPPSVDFPYPERDTKKNNSPSTPIARVRGGVTAKDEDDFERMDKRPAFQKKSLTDRPPPREAYSFLSLKHRPVGPRKNSTQRSKRRGTDIQDLPHLDDQLEHVHGIASNQSGSGNRPRKRIISGGKKLDGPTAPYGRFEISNDQFQTKGKVSKRDGRLNISVNDAAHQGYLAKAFGGAMSNLGIVPGGDSSTTDPSTSDAALSQASTALERDARPLPKLNIVVMVIGSRGDIQPFLKIGKVLKEEYGHRVRIATHPAFKDFVEKDTDLEFFSVGGDPAELMAFMVKNPGLVPSIETVKAGDIGRRRDQMFEMFQGFWRACINATDDEKDIENVKMMGKKNPFVADAIIANPPSFAHIHCAERLGIPLHIMFTFPYSPTQQFPHPLANIKKSNVDANYTNFMSYPLVEMMTWQGLGDLVNRFRVKTLGLEPVSTLWAPGQLYRLKVPYTYLWSPSLVPKPPDWGPEIDIAGFVFLDLATNFKPPEDLAKFLEADEQPVYIGFGSIVVDDPDKFTQTIFEAVKKTGVRALVSKGWGGLGDDNVPENIYMLENTPHDWLFPRVTAVIHHGGAGTTAIGLKCGKPAMIVPFFGDQPFWGAMIAKAGAGPEPVPYKRLTVDVLADGIRACLSPEAKANSERLAKRIEEEGDGAENAVQSFHRSLRLQGEKSMRCSILEDRVGVWRLKHTEIRLSAMAAEVLIEKKKIHWRDLRLLRHNEWNDFDGPGEPVTGAGAAIAGSVAGVAKGFFGVPVKWAKRIRKHEKREEMRKQRLAVSNEDAKKQSAETNAEKKTNKMVNGASKEAIDEKADDATKDDSNEDLDYDSDSSSSDSSDDWDDLAIDMAEDARKGLGKSGKSFIKAPMNISLAIAQGFHNAPRLYGDTTVRRPTPITGFHSGLRASRNEFLFGIYDGWTGLIYHPYHETRTHGCKGIFKGIGKGIGGFLLKDIAAMCGPVAYTLKGIHKELQKDRGPTAFIRKARIVQGQKELNEVKDENQRREVFEKVLKGWKVVQKVRQHEERQRRRGIKGRLQLLREKKAWHQHGAYENVGKAQTALDAQKEGKSVGEALGGEREAKEIQAITEGVGRKPVMSNGKEGGIPKAPSHENGEVAMAVGRGKKAATD